jgi:hypothetical protein
MELNKLINLAEEKYQLKQNRVEIEELITFLSGKNIKNFCEIGTHFGGTYFLLSHIATGKKISIDYCSGTFGGIGWLNSKERNKDLDIKDSFFIEGSSQSYETIKSLKDILNGELLDLLFIDGDHTYKGVKNDYHFYKQFVKDDGYIVFHDINDTKFHRDLNCNVSKFWDELLSSELRRQDMSINYKVFTINNYFGGIGVLQYHRPKDIQIHQIYYNQESKDKCDYSLLPYINSEKSDYYENAVIIDIYNKNYDCKYIGVTSWRLEEKIKISGKDLIDFVRYSNKDICIYSPDCSDLFPGQIMDIWQLNKKIWDGWKNKQNIYKIAEKLANEKILDIDIFKDWTYCFCNFFVCKKDIYDKYVSDILIRTIEFLESKKYKDYFDTLILEHRGGIYKIHTFFLEGMFGSFLSNNNYSKIDYLKYEFLKVIKPKLISTQKSNNKLVKLKDI